MPDSVGEVADAQLAGPESVEDANPGRIAENRGMCRGDGLST